MEGLSQEEAKTRWEQIIKSGGTCSSEEYSLIRKMIVASLAENLGGAQIRHPLSLVDPTLELSDSVELTGAQLDYVDGIKRYSEGHAHFSDVIKQQKVLSMKVHEQQEAENRRKALDQEILDLHLQVAKLQKEHDQRRAVIKYLHELKKMPAAQPDFLDPEVMYGDCRPMPEMPKEMIDGFATDHSATDVRADELLQNLKKHVLRSKLVAQRQQADHVRNEAERPLDLDGPSPEAKLHALNAVKNELINWIETNLAQAGDDAANSDAEEKPKVQYDHQAMMKDIQHKYQRHIELRQEILSQLAQLDHIKDKVGSAETNPPRTHTTSTYEGIPPPTYVPEAYLLTPYIEQLQTLARRQKSMVQEKSYINSSLARQQEGARQTLDHLAEDSQLLSRFPTAQGPSKPQISFEHNLVDKPTVRDQVQPWIYAADSAKLATLMEVAESVEVGMESIDEARVHLEQVCELLNIPCPQIGDESVQKDASEDGDKSPTPRKELAKKDDDDSTKTIWDILDGNLGSINE